jgi:ankyrin repeat protein
VDYYREKSLSLDGRDLTGRTSLHEAARSGRSESVKALLDGGAVVDIRDHRGRTPLHAAAEFEDIPASRVLQHDYDKKDPFMEDPIVCYFPRAKPKDAFDKMDLILSKERDAKHIRQVVRLLLAGGADAGALDDNQHSPSDVAIMLGTVAVVDELAPQVVDLYSGPGKALASTGLQSLDPLGEWIFSFPSKNIGSYVKTLDLQPDTFTLLERAISYGNVAIVEEIVREKRPPLIRADGSSPIHLIARWGLTVMMEKLLSYIDDIQAFSPPLLHVATERVQPNTEMIKLLIKCGVDVNAEYRKEPDPEFSPLTVSTAIHKLATGKHWWHPKALSILLDAGADPKIENEAGRTALQVALSTGSSSRDYGTGFWSGHSLEVLLKHGAEVNFLSSKGLTPLNTALQQNRGPHILQKLLDYGADGSFGPVPATASAVDSLDYTSLEMLLKAGANPNVVYKATSVKRYGDKANFETLLMNAACPPRHYSLGEDQEPTGDLGKRSSIISLLLQYGADPLHPLNDCSTSVLHEICAVNGLVKPMLARGVDLGRKDSKGRTPLLRACDLDDSYRRSIETEYTALVLIESGVDIHAVDDAGLTALHLAIESNLPKTTKKLLEHGVSATVKDNIGLTPLYYAFTKSKYFWESMKVKRWAVETLLDAGANALERGPEGQTSLHYLVPRLMQTSSIDGRDLLSEYRRPDSPDEFAELSKLYERCIKAGCDREARDNNGNTPLFPYVAAIKSYSDLETPNPPDEKDLRKMFAEHDIHAVNNDGDTLLHVVARRPDSHEILDDTLNLFKLLVELGLDPRKENKHQVTALDVAAACGNEKVLALFARNE